MHERLMSCGGALAPVPKRRDATVLLTELPLDPPGGGCGSSRARSTGTRRSAAPTTWPSTRSCRPRTWSTTRLLRSGSSLRRRPDAMTARRDSAPRPLPPLSPAVPWASGLAHAGVVLIVHKINIQTGHTLGTHCTPTHTKEIRAPAFFRARGRARQTEAKNVD